MNQLEIRDLKTYFFLDEGILKAVDGVNLTIGDRETIGIIGRDPARMDRDPEVPRHHRRSVIRGLDRPRAGGAGEAYLAARGGLRHGGAYLIG